MYTNNYQEGDKFFYFHNGKKRLRCSCNFCVTFGRNRLRSFRRLVKYFKCACFVFNGPSQCVRSITVNIRFSRGTKLSLDSYYYRWMIKFKVGFPILTAQANLSGIVNLFFFHDRPFLGYQRFKTAVTLTQYAN